MGKAMIDDEDDEYPDMDSAKLMLRYLVRSWGLPANDETREYSVRWGLKAIDRISVTAERQEESPSAVPVYLGQTRGWLSPSGDFYASRDVYSESDIARSISYGWVWVDDNGTIRTREDTVRRINPAQRLALQALMDLSPSSRYSHQMRTCLASLDALGEAYVSKTT